MQDLKDLKEIAHIPHRYIEDKEVVAKLRQIEKAFFTVSPLDAIKRYYVDIVAQLPKDGPDTEFVQAYVNLVQARQFQRLGMFKEAYRIIDNMKSTTVLDPENVSEIGKSVILYLEWIMVARKVYYKQMFQQRTLDMLSKSLKFCV